MGDVFYDLVVTLGRPVFWMVSRRVMLHPERINRRGAFILAANHISPYDVPVLMRESPRDLDWVSITEFFRRPLLHRFFGGLNAFPLDRTRTDPLTVRVILERLRRRRVVAMFPEGGWRPPKTSVLHGGPFKPGVVRIAQLADVPIIPCVVLGTRNFNSPLAWLPIRRTRYAVAFGQAIWPRKDLSEGAAREVALAELQESYLLLYQELSAASGITF
ncbi:MAG TPA: lysophospholipid acyltransferase family protein [Tepidisphaeraceae bacterium]